jgi:hypothetical protein
MNRNIRERAGRHEKRPARHYRIADQFTARKVRAIVCAMS